MDQDMKYKIKDFIKKFLLSFVILFGFSILVYVIFVLTLMAA